MKYCLQGRQPLALLKRADEIKVQYKDREQILDFIQQIPDKTFLLEVPVEGEIDWNLIYTFAEKIDFILCFNKLDINHIEQCKDKNIKWYWNYPITSFYELKSIAALGPSYLYLGAPLCFDLVKVRKITDIPIRLIPNVAELSYIPQENGICGPWIRPEGIPAYERYINCIDFASTGLEQEATYFKIYHDDKEWPGNLNILFIGLKDNVNNLGLPTEIDEMRTTCGQKCMESGRCSFCATGFAFSKALKSYVENKLKN